MSLSSLKEPTKTVVSSEESNDQACRFLLLYKEEFSIDSDVVVMTDGLNAVGWPELVIYLGPHQNAEQYTSFTMIKSVKEYIDTITDTVELEKFINNLPEYFNFLPKSGVLFKRSKLTLAEAKYHQTQHLKGFGMNRNKDYTFVLYRPYSLIH